MTEGSEPTFPDRIAHAVTFVVSPPALPPFLVWLVLAWAGAPAEEAVSVAALTFIVLSAVPTVFLLWMVKSGRSPSINLEAGGHRAAALGIGIAGALLLAGLTYRLVTVGRALLLATLAAFVVTAVVLVIVSRSWRISLHAASVAGFLGVALFVAGFLAESSAAGSFSPTAVAVASIPVLLLVCWSRLRLHAHSPAQVAAGAVVGLAIPFGTLELIEALGMLHA